MVSDVAYRYLVVCVVFFFFNDTATTEIYTLSLHDALPIHAEGGMRLQHDLAGKTVTLTFRNDKLGSVTGTLVKLAKPEMPEGTMAGERPAAYPQDQFL